MWSSLGFVALRGVRAGSVVSLPFAARVVSRTAIHPAILVASASRLRPALHIRGYAAARAAAKKVSSAKKTATKKKPMKKAAARKTPKRSVPKKATKAKKRATGAKRKAAAKKPAKKKVGAKKKPMSEEKKKLLLRRELKTKALLSEPANLPVTAWNVFIAEHMPSKNITDTTTFTQAIKGLSAAFKDLPPTEIQRLVSKGKQNAEKNAATYKSWVQKYEPIQIRDANFARQRLHREFKMRKYPKIDDPRLPKLPLSAFTTFIQTRFSDSPKATTVADSQAAMKKFSDEWNKMSDAQRKPFMDRAGSDRAKYVRDVKTILGREVKPPSAAATK